MLTVDQAITQVQTWLRDDGEAFPASEVRIYLRTAKRICFQQICGVGSRLFDKIDDSFAVGDGIVDLSTLDLMTLRDVGITKNEVTTPLQQTEPTQAYKYLNIADYQLRLRYVPIPTLSATGSDPLIQENDIDHPTIDMWIVAEAAKQANVKDREVMVTLQQQCREYQATVLNEQKTASGAKAMPARNQTPSYQYWYDIATKELHVVSPVARRGFGGPYGFYT